jgi:hypothetical protein
MPSSFTDARKRQLARLDGVKPPTARAAMALAKSQAYQDAADAPATLRAYAADLANYQAWCEKHGFEPMPATCAATIRMVFVLPHSRMLPRTDPLPHLDVPIASFISALERTAPRP